MEKCGFVQIRVEDRSELYQQYCRREIEIAEKNRTNASSVNDFLLRNRRRSFWMIEFRKQRVKNRMNVFGNGN